MPVSLSALAPSRVRLHNLLDGREAFTGTATTLFVDLVGFTPLTDTLGRFGSRGTEQLSEVLQGFFGAVTEQALRNGGDPVAYGGDALTIVFDGDGAPTLAAAKRLANSINGMTEVANRKTTLAGTVSLETRIGIGRGPVTTTVIRSATRSLPLQLGAGLDRAAEAETRAEVGQIVLHESATAIAVAGLSEPPDTGDESRTSSMGSATESDMFEDLVHPAVLQHLRVDSSLWQIHRTATVAFLGFRSVAPDAVTDFVKAGAQLIQHVTDCGGEVVQISGGDKGVVALVVFGTPIGHDDDELRALQALVEYRKLVPSVRVGVTTGPVFTTWLGSDQRRLQAHFGGALNMAARLMQAGKPHEILVDAATWREAGPYLRQRGGPRQVTVKGHDEPLEVHDVVGWRRRRRRPPVTVQLALAGRDIESDLIEGLLDGAHIGRGSALTFEGAAGVGKSRLAGEAVARARTRGMPVLKVDAHDYPYGQMSGLWREIVGRRLGIDPSVKRSEWHEALRRRLPGESVRLDLLGPVLGIGLGGYSPARPLAPELAVELAQDLVAQLVVDAPRPEPTLIVIENVHHFPSVSRALLTSIQRRVERSSVGLITTERSLVDAGEPLDRGGSIRALPELSEAESASLVEDAWTQAGGGSPPAWLAPRVFERAGGNPLFLLSATARVKSLWHPGDPPPHEGSEIDESPTKILSERMDLLDAEQRQVLALLAVARRPCAVATSVEALSGQVDAKAIQSAILSLQEEAFIQRVAQPRGDAYRIRHEVMRRVLYEQMRHADRVRFHRIICDLLIGEEASPGEIADHVRHLDDAVLGRAWFPRAAAEARRTWQVTAAVEWWRLALPLLTARARAEADVELLELLLVAGRPSEVLAARPTDLPDADAFQDQQYMSADLMVRQRVALAEAAFACSEFAYCEQQCSHVMRSEARTEAQYQVAAELAVRSMCDRGGMTEAIALARAQLERAAETGDHQYMATAHASLGAALLLSGDPESATRHYDAALASAIAAGDTIHQIHVLSDLAGCAYASDDYPTCLDLLGKARTLAESIGYRRHLQYNLINEAQLRAGLGDPHCAACAYAAIELSLEFGDTASVADVLDMLLQKIITPEVDVETWKRLARAEERLGRTLFVADCYAAIAVGAARRGDARTVEVASKNVRAHPEVTPGSQLDRRVELAARLLAASALPAGARADRQTLAAELETLAADPDVSAVERAEFAMAAWCITSDDAGPGTRSHSGPRRVRRRTVRAGASLVRRARRADSCRPASATRADRGHR